MSAIEQESIAILTWGLRGGSLTNYTAALVEGFWQAGLRNLSVFYIADGVDPHVQFPAGVELVPLGAKRSRWMPFYLARRIRELQPTYLISVSAFINIPAILGWWLAGKGKTRLIVSQHSTMSYKAYVELKHDWKERFQPFLARLLYPQASGLHANSQAVLDDLLHTIRIPMPLERTIATDNPVNLEVIQRYSQVAPEHPWLQHKDKPVLVSVGRLAQQKNFPALIESFTLVQTQLDCRLIIFGEGPERENLTRQIHALGLASNVSLPGFTSNPWCNMAQADLFVLPSEEEPFGLVLVEAMACGVPIVATDAIGGGPRIVLEGGRYGRLIPAQDVQLLAAALVDLLRSPEQQQHFRELGQERCQAYRPDRIAQQWIPFLEKMGALPGSALGVKKVAMR